MENHPIPQNITGFEFKLIGDMTLKQFAYLAGGAIIAWIIYSLPLFVLIKYPLVAIFAGLGAAFAFLPIDGRPLDLMLKNFMKAVFSPTQYLYQKAEGQLLTKDEAKLKDFNQKRLTISQMSDKQLSDFLKNLPKGISKLDKKEMVFFQNLNQYGQTATPTSVPGYVKEHAYSTKGEANQPVLQNAPVSQNPNQKVSLPNEDLQKTAELLTRELKEAKAKESAQPAINSKDYLEAHAKVLELQKSLNDLAFQKQQLESRIMELQKQVQADKTQVFSPSVAQPAEQTQFVRSVPSNLTKSVGLPSTPEFPNIVTGIVKDPRGNPLGNILVEVKDAQANAVRAFKTNALGHFASATPLNNGSYTIEFEDPKGQNRFDSVGFVAKGEIILPIEVISVDQREDLRRTLFN